jgi:hypothetical protein
MSLKEGSKAEYDCYVEVSLISGKDVFSSGGHWSCWTVEVEGNYEASGKTMQPDQCDV